MDCKEHSGVCANIENIQKNCVDHRSNFEKQLEEINHELKSFKVLTITTLIGVLIQLMFFLLNNLDKLFAVVK